MPKLMLVRSLRDLLKAPSVLNESQDMDAPNPELPRKRVKTWRRKGSELTDVVRSDCANSSVPNKYSPTKRKRLMLNPSCVP